MTVINSSNYKAIARAKKAAEPLVIHWKGASKSKRKAVDPKTNKLYELEEVHNYYEEACTTYREGEPWIRVTTVNKRLAEHLRNYNRKEPGTVQELSHMFSVGAVTYWVKLQNWEEIETQLSEQSKEAAHNVAADN